MPTMKRPPTKNEIRINSLERQIDCLRADLEAERQHSRRLAEQLQAMFNGLSAPRAGQRLSGVMDGYLIWVMDKILQACNALDASFPMPGGPLVTFDRIRSHAKCHGIPKADFDGAVMAFAHTSSAVALHQHSYPHSLSAAEQQVFVADGSGSFYVGLATK